MKKGNGELKPIIMIVIFTFLFLVFISFLTIRNWIKEREIKDNNCLKQIAEDYCNEINKDFSSIIYNGDYAFKCGDKREHPYSTKIFYFLDKELEKCEVGG